MDHRYPRDYRAVTRGRRGPMGCGVDACARPDEVHQFNYFHPDFHPYWQGRDVHTLQSVTKSVAATLIGIAIGQGRIAGTDANLLGFLWDYDRVDRGSGGPRWPIS